MAKIEIDLTKEINKAIEKEVEARLDKLGLLGFIRNCVKTEFENSGSKKQLRKHEQELVMIKRRLEKLTKYENGKESIERINGDS